MKRYWLSVIMFACLQAHLFAQKAQVPPPPLSNGKTGLVYVPDSLGNRIPDFSYAGYMAGNADIPMAPVKVMVPAIKGDATLRIQSAIDYVASLPADANGLRGAVLLQSGKHEVAGTLLINQSGIVLRGAGMGETGTILVATNTDRSTLIRVTGKNDRVLQPAVRISDLYVPVNSTFFTVPDGSAFKAGDKLIIHRPSTQDWIAATGTAHFGGGISALGWKPGQRDIYWDRVITAVEGNQLSIDAPLTTALDTAYGGGFVSKYNWPGRIANTGIENIRLISDYDLANPKDEAHSWMAITIENVSDVWVRQMVFQHFAGSAVAVWNTANRVTVEDCKSLSPVSEIGGQRRNSFYTEGGQTLFQRLYSENAFHDFGTGFCTPGPTAFVQCQSQNSYSFSGGIDSWSSGVLFDIVNIDGNALSYMNRGQDGQGAGWAAANSVFWQCTAARIDCYKPFGANNWAFGTWAQFAGDGYWHESNNSINPRSLYYAQLKERLGNDVSVRAQLLPFGGEASTSPSVETAALLTEEASQPILQMYGWIDSVAKYQPIDTSSSGVRAIDAIGVKKLAPIAKAGAFELKNGWLVRGNGVATGNTSGIIWWNGSSRPYASDKAKPHITRFVPGQVGNGLTDDLQVFTDTMLARNLLAIDHNYGLWYDRRRDDHERIRRMDGDVWPPFYELPFARSGQGLAWDGLSKYDLTKYNSFYWQRLKQFADLADQKGLVLVQQHYFQHNIIEAGAHYADFPWRPANNINGTPFVEPVNYAGDKRIFYAAQFYDISNASYRELHKAYIRKCLSNFSENTGVLHLISAEYTGPLHFVKFWLETIAGWEKETGLNALVGLSTTKDVQDSILGDPKYAAIVDVIDIRYWQYNDDGTTYAPKGGQNLAPRQHARLVKVGRSSAAEVYKAVKEYRLAHPGKAVTYSGDNFGQQGWPAFMAGGSLANIPRIKAAGFHMAAATMQPHATVDFVLADNKGGYIIYLPDGATADVQKLGIKGKAMLHWIDTKSGSVLKQGKIKNIGSQSLTNGFKKDMVLWVSLTGL